MIKVNIAEAKAQLSRLLRAVRKGDMVTICERNVPVAELRCITARRKTKRPLGPAIPGYEIPDAFFEPLPEELLASWEGREV
ncbi:MAG: type II toxin-antitoxin system Phd/YefM family antitoxin [Vulcanimicrobiaceae bacterium]